LDNTISSNNHTISRSSGSNERWLSWLVLPTIDSIVVQQRMIVVPMKSTTIQGPYRSDVVTLPAHESAFRTIMKIIKATAFHPMIRFGSTMTWSCSKTKGESLLIIYIGREKMICCSGNAKKKLEKRFVLILMAVMIIMMVMISLLFVIFVQVWLIDHCCRFCWCESANYCCNSLT
jgi:hypothetical protein